jgi:hypothetical protein
MNEYSKSKTNVKFWDIQKSKLGSVQWGHNKQLDGNLNSKERHVVVSSVCYGLRCNFTDVKS